MRGLCFIALLGLLGPQHAAGAKVDCVVKSTSWSACSAACNTGRTTRTHTVVTAPSATGKQCPSGAKAGKPGVETAFCNHWCCAGHEAHYGHNAPYYDYRHRLPHGHVDNEPFNGECRVCLNGKFSAKIGDLRGCRLCPSGKHQPSAGNTSCAQCLPGYYSVPDAAACDKCADGSQTDNLFEASTCTACTTSTVLRARAT